MALAAAPPTAPLTAPPTARPISRPTAPPTTPSAPAAAQAAPGAAASEKPAQKPAVRLESTIVITEVMYNPASDEAKGQPEWVEIANLGPDAVELVDWRLDDEDTLPFDQWGRFSCTLAPGAIAVLVNASTLDEAQFRAAWDPRAAANGEGAPTDGAAAASTPPSGGHSSPAPASARTPASDSAASPASDSPDALPANSYQVIAVKWGGISNNPGPRKAGGSGGETVGNEVLQLRDGEDRIRCEVSLRNGDGWPKLSAAGGPSVYLAEPTNDLNDGSRWRSSTPGIDGARECSPTAIFNGRDIGSPGQVPARVLASGRANGATTPAPASGAASAPTPPPAGQPTAPAAAPPVPAVVTTTPTMIASLDFRGAMHQTTPPPTPRLTPRLALQQN